MKIKKLAIIGVGLIGGSFALALREKGLVETVIGCGRNQKNLDTAIELGIIDEYFFSIKDAVKDADLIFLATPVSQSKAIFQQLKGHTKAGAVITDGGSTKCNIIDAAIEVFGELPDFIVPGHPVAGTENSGAAAAFPSLYLQHKVILTPHEHSDKQALQWVESLWTAIGAKVVTMTAEHHDFIMGATSHLPHALAFSLVNMLANINDNKEVFEYVAGGFKDFTRIASSDPEMWRDICVANKPSLLLHLKMYQGELSSLIDILENDQQQQLQQLFTRAKKARDKLLLENK